MISLKYRTSQFFQLSYLNFSIAQKSFSSENYQIVFCVGELKDKNYIKRLEIIKYYLLDVKYVIVYREEIVLRVSLFGSV